MQQVWLGAYNTHKMKRTIVIGDLFHAKAKCHSWNYAEFVQFLYCWIYKTITLTPKVEFIQSNILTGQIRENKPKGLNLQTESKTDSYLDTILSLAIEIERIHATHCIIPFIIFGWHNVIPLSNPIFKSRLDTYCACAPNFITRTYCNQRNRFLVESGLRVFHCNDWGIVLTYRGEFGKGEFISALECSFDWNF